MVYLYRCDADASEELRAKQINEVRAELVSRLISNSTIGAGQIVTISITVKKVRNRSATRTRDSYVISAHLNAL